MINNSSRKVSALVLVWIFLCMPLCTLSYAARDRDLWKSYSDTDLLQTDDGFFGGSLQKVEFFDDESKQTFVCAYNSMILFKFPDRRLKEITDSFYKEDLIVLRSFVLHEANYSIEEFISLAHLFYYLAQNSGITLED